MSDRLDLSGDFPVWGAVVYHSEKSATNPWCRAFNVSSGSKEEQEKEALKVTRELFEKDGLSAITIYSLELAPLIPLEGGEDA